MKLRLARLCVGMLLLTILAANVVFAADWMWAKGNLHAHTTNSDGDSTPQVVADWYRDHGYQFLAITDHGMATDAAPLDTDPKDGFVLITGEECGVIGAKEPIHVNAIGISQTIRSPEALVTPGRSVQNLVNLIREAAGIPMVNHPNWRWSLSHRELLQIRGPYLLEIANMGGGNNNEGSLSWLSTEQTWDVLLSQGQTVYATATDDVHALKAGPKGVAGPGKGWVVARVSALTQSAVVEALSNGEFYASNGVELSDYSFDGKEFRVSVEPKPDQKYLIGFVGKWGSILQETTGTSARYRFAAKREQNSYVRCKVIASDGTVAWTQAYRVGG